MITSAAQIESKMYLIRGQKIMLSQHLAELYEVEPRTLNQAVKRNLSRFPADFMFQLSPEEFTNLKSQFVISSWGGIRTAPYAFTEQGVAMLSSVLHSERAIQTNIESHEKELLAPAWLKKTLPALKRPLISDAWLGV